jgi:hypothetical protein
MHPMSMKRWPRKLLDALRHLPVARWMEADFTVPVRSVAKRPDPAAARRRRAEGQTRLQGETAAGARPAPVANGCLSPEGRPHQTPRRHPEA